jgi:hypothetical protein
MFDDSFQPLEHGAAAKILDLVNPKLDGSPFDPAMARILAHALPFYPNCKLVEISDHDVNPPRLVSAVLLADHQVFILEGNNEPIFALNEAVPINLTNETAKTYVRFFFTYVRGRHGRFKIVENPDEIDWREEPAPNARKALGKMINPLTLVSENPDEYVFRASIIFKDSLFESDIHVGKNGMINVKNQELLVEDIPVVDDNFSQ